MMDERQFIARVEAADPEEYARLLAHPSKDEEAALRTHLGDGRYERQHELAARGETRGRAEKRGNLVVIHGIMGGELTAYDRSADADRVWVHLPRLIAGGIDRIWLADDGLASRDARWDVRATGIMKRSYGEQILRLSQEWNVRAYWYDWRKDLRKAADLLAASLDNWFGPDEPVHLVAHSMGGLVSRSFIQRHGDRWKRMWDDAGDGRAGGRLIMLGTPNHGSFAVPQIVTGLEGMVRKLAMVDVRHKLPEILQVILSFPGSYQMLPSPFVLPDMEPLYRSETWGVSRRVPQQHLTDARAFHTELRPVVDPARMVYVAGYNRRTFCEVRDLKLAEADAYVATLEGDGRVPHSLGLLDGVDTYYVDEVHGSLPGNGSVLAAMTDLLETGRTEALPAKMPRGRSVRSAAALREAHARDVARNARDEDALELYVRHEQVRGEAAAERQLLSGEERRMEEIVLRGWLYGEEEERAAPAADAEIVVAATGRPVTVTLAVQLVAGDIERADELMAEPPDAIAVGHYVGVRPQFAERALDIAVTRALRGLGPDTTIADPDLLLTGFTERGTIRGELGQPFLLPDPRRPGRVVAIAGMGLPGRFGSPELSVLARELAWSLGQLGKNHLATVLIGAGAGNLDTEEALGAWMRGLQHAIAASADADHGAHISRITFVERDPQRVMDLDRAIRDQDRWFERAGGMDIVYQPLAEARLRQLEAQALEQRVARARAERTSEPAPEPTRVTLGFDRREKRRGVYRFGALTRSASVPEREVPLDPTLVDEANDGLPGMDRIADQIRRGKYLERLLVPRDLREAMATNAPLVMLLDSATARIHWEMVAQPDVVPPDADDVEGCFLGTSRGFTRQLRTTFAAVPEAPPPPRRPLRVLIVADPAEDARLPGALREGYEIQELFQRFNQVFESPLRSVEVRSLLGPGEATRTAVLDELFSRQYDVLHFAGHCAYEEDDPASSGWIFGDGARLSANELRRVDHIPKFVFSNACESGITPDRSEKRDAALAPSFAEAFFERGVANFVCTAWPVDDAAALGFAAHLYSALLGLPAPEAGADPRDPQPMHEAMKEARVAVARMGTGRRSWGAYQHYGNPNFRFFEASPLRSPAQRAAAGTRSRSRKR